ncbi:MAG: hypothetical protein AAFZ07_20255 [Actinomycetota bacterium]
MTTLAECGSSDDPILHTPVKTRHNVHFVPVREFTHDDYRSVLNAEAKAKDTEAEVGKASGTTETRLAIAEAEAAKRTAKRLRERLERATFTDPTDSKRYVRCEPDHEARLGGKLFVGLGTLPEDLDHLVESLDWSTGYELRHNPPGGRKQLRTVPLVQLTTKQATRIYRLQNGRVVYWAGEIVTPEPGQPFEGIPCARVDYGVLQKVRVPGGAEGVEQAKQQVRAWRDRLVEQLMS